MAPKREFEPNANDHEAGSSRQIAPGTVGAAAGEDLRHRGGGADLLGGWRPMPWGDAHLHHGWHLSPDRVPVPPIPATARARLAEIQRRRAQLPADLR
jgi:hypothetical protein